MLFLIWVKKIINHRKYAVIDPNERINGVELLNDRCCLLITTFILVLKLNYFYIT